MKPFSLSTYYLNIHTNILLTMLQCECRACVEKWPLRDAVPDELARIPNFEQERCFVVRHGDKKDICDEINGARWMADFGIASNTFSVAQEALDLLSVCLHKHVVKPHLHFVEASEMAEMFAINQYCRMPLHVVEEEVETKQSAPAELSENAGGGDVAVNGGKTHANNSQKNMKKSEQTVDETEGASKLIKSFESSDKKQNVSMSTPREKSPTLRMFSALNEEESNGKGPRKKSVLDRIEDKFLTSKNPDNNSNTTKAKSKRELADSMRRFPKKEEMAERLSAFQPKTLAPKSWNKDSKKDSEDKDADKKEKERESKDIKEEKNSVIYDFIDTIKDKVTGNKEIKTDEQINDDIDKMIESHRKKIREERKARRNKENRPPVVDPQYEKLENKDSECNREIGKKEQKLNQMIESSNEREKMLKNRELEIQKLREKTRRMLEEAKKKSDEFEATEKSFFKGSEPKSDKVDGDRPRKGKSGQKSNKSMKQANKNKVAESSQHAADDDKDLLAFLRQSHKKKSNIYDFLDPNKPTIIEPPPMVEINNNIIGETLKDTHPNTAASTPIASELHSSVNEPDIDEAMKQIDTSSKSNKSISNGYHKPKLRDVSIMIPKRKFIEDRWEDMKQQRAPPSPPVEAAPPQRPSPPAPPAPAAADPEQILINGERWEARVEDSIRTIETLAAHAQEAATEPPAAEVTEVKHYSARWSEERSTLSPSPCPDRKENIFIYHLILIFSS